MDEDFIKQAFSAMGESPFGVKIITHRITGWVIQTTYHMNRKPLLPLYTNKKRTGVISNGLCLLCSGSAGYCFVELADEASVDRCVQRLNGKLVPGSNPVSSMVSLQNTSSYILMQSFL